MPKRQNQKLKLLYLQQYLLEQTDEAHPATVQQLTDALARNGITAERKSIYSDMETLAEAGLDVQLRRGKEGGWFVGARDFELAELKLLVDAVQASKFITRSKSGALIGKLERLTSVWQARTLRRQVHVSPRVKTINESIYYSIDTLHEAIARGQGVTFQYFEFNVRKERVFRRESRVYEVSPCGLLWDNENYYLAGFDHEKGEMRNYRVDKMAGLALCERLSQPETCRTFDIAAYAQKHFSMFHGREGDVTLRCETRMVGVILDRFGQDVMLIPDGERHFTVTVSVMMSPQFLGWLFGLAPAVTIQKPDWALKEYKKQVQATAQMLGIETDPPP